MSAGEEIYWDGGNWVGPSAEFYLNKLGLEQRRGNAIEEFVQKYGFRPNEEEIIWDEKNPGIISHVLGLQGY